MSDVTIKLIDPSLAKEICKSITGSLPEWFGIPEANERYEQGVRERTSFAASIGNEYIGMITLEFPYPNNANIYWTAVMKGHHREGIGKQLLQFAEKYCLERGFLSMTVETLSHKQNDENYSKTYLFYNKLGFKPLFDMYTYGSDNLMVYMQKNICPLKQE